MTSLCQDTSTSFGTQNIRHTFGTMSDTASTNATTGHAPLRVGGVPEHFNIPWQLASQDAANRSLFEFIEQPKGTGEMITNLKEGKLDVIVALTEGLVAEIARGSDLRLLGTYVESPLVWAISTGKTSAFESIEDLRGQKFGISRFQSGSHLMSCVLALQRHWDVKTDIAFEVKGNFQSLRDSVNDGSTAAFMWETFMTKPYHDSGEVRRIGEIVTPWPCFMMAARRSTIDARLEDLKRLQTVIQTACLRFAREPEQMQARIVQQYHLKPADAAQWFAHAQVTGSNSVSEAALERTISTLIDAGVLSSDVNTDDLELYLDTRLCHLSRDIHSMKLYNKPELVASLFAQLRAAGLARGHLSYQQLLPFDQHHYGGTDDVDKAFALTVGAQDGTNSQPPRVVNIGSGLGGPARYLAGRYGCDLLAIELQDELSRTAAELTSRCGLDSQVTHVLGDFLQVSKHLQAGGYDACVSWLTVLHFTDRHALMKSCARLLRSGGGRMYAADFFAKRPLTKVERRTLAADVWCRYLPDEATYKADIEQAGMQIVEWEDCTAAWTAMTKQRADSFDAQRELTEPVYGAETWQGLSSFYRVVANLFAGGNLGGVRLTARKP